MDAKRIFKITRKVTIFMLLFLVCTNLFSQRKITGKVLSGDDEAPLPSVAVISKGTSNGTMTDFDGNYEITVSGEKAILVFSYLGYKQ